MCVFFSLISKWIYVCYSTCLIDSVMALRGGMIFFFFFHAKCGNPPRSFKYVNCLHGMCVTATAVAPAVESMAQIQ